MCCYSMLRVLGFLALMGEHRHCVTHTLEARCSRKPIEHMHAPTRRSQSSEGLDGRTDERVCSCVGVVCVPRADDVNFGKVCARVHLPQNDCLIRVISRAVGVCSTDMGEAWSVWRVLIQLLPSTTTVLMSCQCLLNVSFCGSYRKDRIVHRYEFVVVVKVDKNRITELTNICLVIATSSLLREVRQGSVLESPCRGVKAKYKT